ncbi:MAG: MFS transporter [Proteobacteria bacterium]|nr:MFS transporter [Pseudomonadota bacterium]MBU4469862.1 MFS transporter [Pseudomonadota bacterium]MCG2753097.1 MFS transporter [Desulfobacteraceae bacterium]
MKTDIKLQLIVFALVAAAFTTIYITQPVLPVLLAEFSTTLIRVSMTVSMVILGMAISNLPFGFLADRFPIRPIILIGGLMVATFGLICALANDIRFLIAARFLQGLFIPSMTTCIAAYLAKTLPAEKLNMVMGSYVSATVLGGMTGRLIGGLIRPPLNWRHALVAASILVLVAVISAYKGLPRTVTESAHDEEAGGFQKFMGRGDLLRIYFCGAGSFAIFSSIFNYLPFRLTSAPFNYSTQRTTLLYLVYVVGIFMGPLAGKASNRFGTGRTMLLGTFILCGALAMILFPSITMVISGLVFLCAGFFAIHTSAVGALNQKLKTGQGTANAVYVLFYYLGGWLGITLSGFFYKIGGFPALVWFCIFFCPFPWSQAFLRLETLKPFAYKCSYEFSGRPCVSI